MTLNIASQQEQQQRIQDDLVVVQNQEEYILDTGVYSEGYFEGYIGSEPRQPEDESYWSGYQIGLGCRECWAKKRGVEIPCQF